LGLRENAGGIGRGRIIQRKRDGPCADFCSGRQFGGERREVTSVKKKANLGLRKGQRSDRPISSVCANHV